MQTFSAELIRIRTLSESTRDFRFVADCGEVDFVPGQFFRFVFTDEDGEFERSYSVCNFLEDATGDVMDLVISTVNDGRASKLLFSAGPGLSAQVTGPFGRLVLPAQLPKRLFLVATSVGIAPYMPMLAQLARAFKNGKVPLEVHFLYGARDQSEFVYGETLMAFAEQHREFHLHLCVSRSEVDDDLPVEQLQGYVQDKLFALEPDPGTDHILLCGNPNMIDVCYPQLRELGFGVRQVVREKYVFAKDKSTKVKPKQELSVAQKKLLAEKMKKYQQ